MNKILSGMVVLALASGVAMAKTGTTTGANGKMAPAKAGAPLKQVLTCPVMGGKIASTKVAAGYSDYKGSRYYFCCKSCKPEFDKNPAAYIAKMSKPGKARG